MSCSGFGVLFQHGNLVSLAPTYLAYRVIALIRSSRRYRYRPWLMAIEVLRCWLTNHVGAANEISAMHRNAARFSCDVFNDQISRGQTDGRICIWHLHRYRLICLHGAEMRAEVLRAKSRGVFAQTVGIVTLRTDSKAIV